MTTLRLNATLRFSPLVAAALAFLIAILAVANLAAAHVVQVTTAVDLTDIRSPHDFERALQAAVEQAAHDAIAFEPTVVALTGARVLGDRVLVSVLFADEDGKAMLESLGAGGDPSDDDGLDRDVQHTKITI
jgi:hypothetical protein